MTHNHNRPVGKQRHGWTLIEMLIVISATGVLTVTGAITIGMMMTADGRGAESLVHQTSIARLSAQFRSDLHATTEVSIEDINGAEQQQLVLQQVDGSTITYQAAEGMLERQVDSDTNDGRREGYRLPEGRMHFEFLREDRIVQFVLEARRQPMTEIAAGELPAPATDRITIEAAMEWDLRHSGHDQRNVDAEE